MLVQFRQSASPPCEPAATARCSPPALGRARRVYARAISVGATGDEKGRSGAGEGRGVRGGTRAAAERC